MENKHYYNFYNYLLFDKVCHLACTDYQTIDGTEMYITKKSKSIDKISNVPF